MRKGKTIMIQRVLLLLMVAALLCGLPVNMQAQGEVTVETSAKSIQVEEELVISIHIVPQAEGIAGIQFTPLLPKGWRIESVFTTGSVYTEGHVLAFWATRYAGRDASIQLVLKADPDVRGMHVISFKGAKYASMDTATYAIEIPAVEVEVSGEAFGDLNKDQTTDERDLLHLIEYLVSDEEQAPRPDLNTDQFEEVDILDLIKLLEFILDN